MNHRDNRISIKFLLLIVCLPLGSVLGAAQELSLDEISRKISDGKQYMGGYPSTEASPRKLQERFLEFDAGRINKIDALNEGLDAAMGLLKQPSLTNDQRARTAEMAGTALRLLLQGWNYAGHLALLDGLRIVYPNSTDSVTGESQNPPPPPPKISLTPLSSCLPNLGREIVEINDLCRAQGFFEEGLRLVLNTLASRNQGQAQPEVLVLDGRSLDESRYPRNLNGWFDKKSFPQYTHFIDDKKIIPILTEGYQVGEILQKYLQTVQTIALREWIAASFSGKEPNEAIPSALRDQAVRSLYMSSHHAFLADLAFAAQASDQAEIKGQSPYRLARLNTARANLENSRETIYQIRTGEKPVLPVDDITASDDQIFYIHDVILRSINSAEISYKRAIQSINNQFNSEVSEENDIRVIDQWLNDLEQLTGFVFDTESSGKKLLNEASIKLFRSKIENKIRSIISQDKNNEFKDYSNITNTLDKRIDEFLVSVFRYNHQALIIRTAENNIEIMKEKHDKTQRIIQDSSSETQNRIMKLGKLSEYGPITVGVSHSFGTNSSTSFSVSTSYDYNAKNKAQKQAEMENIQMNKQIGTLDVENQALIAQMTNDLVIEIDNLKILGNQVNRATHDLNKTIGDVNNLLNRIDRFHQRTNRLWYNDPSVFLVPTIDEEIANQDQDTLVANLYRYGKMLEIRWKEDFKNPLYCDSAEPAYSLGETYEQFMDLESVFNLGKVRLPNRHGRPAHESAQNFLNALHDWDNKLRRCRGISTSRLDPVKISLRQDIFGWRDIERTEDDWRPANDSSRIRSSNIKKFQKRLRENTKQTKNSIGGRFDAIQVTNRLRLTFPLDHLSFRYIIDGGNVIAIPIIPRITNNPWNLRIEKISLKAETSGDKAFSVDEIDDAVAWIAQSGVVYNFSASEICRQVDPNQCPPPSYTELKNYVKYNSAGLNLSGLGQYFMLRTNIAANEFRDTDAIQSKMWSPYCSEWVLEIVTDKISEIGFDNIEDIEIKFEYADGIPPAIRFSPNHNGVTQ